jgi:hypothetical protein
VTLTLIAAMTGAVFLVQRDIERQKPVGVITRAQTEEIAAKQRSLEEQRTLARNGQYGEAVRGYDAHLARWPESVVARVERDEAQRLLDALTTPDAEVTTVARKPRKRSRSDEPVAEKPPEKKASRWERLKRWYRGG